MKAGINKHGCLVLTTTTVLEEKQLSDWLKINSGVVMNYAVDVNSEVNGIETREDKCTLHIVSNNEANNICPDCHKPKRMMNNTLQLLCECESEVAVKGCHNCKNNPHAPFVPKICDSCYAPGLNNWQPLTDC